MNGSSSTQAALTWLIMRGFADLECDGCTLCCKGGALRDYPEGLLQGCTPPEWAIMKVMVETDQEEQCPFLEDEGCGIHINKPDVCRAVDCRVMAMSYPRDSCAMSSEVWDRGWELLRG